MAQYEWLRGERGAKGQDRYRFHVLLCNYETLYQEPELLTSVRT